MQTLVIPVLYPNRLPPSKYRDHGVNVSIFHIWYGNILSLVACLSQERHLELIFTNASEWAWHVESRAWYAEVTGYTATTVHVHFGPLLAGGVQQRPDRGRGRTITSL